MSIDLTTALPRKLVTNVVEANMVVTMGCGDACSIYPGKRYEDWHVCNPAGQTANEVRPIRDEINR